VGILAVLHRLLADRVAGIHVVLQDVTAEFLLDNGRS
jgi:hypothetical protein